MKKLIPLAALVAVLGWSEAAWAQYANKSLTIAPGYLFTDKAVGFDGAIPLYVGGTLYLDGGFELYSHFPLVLVRETASQSWVFGWGNHTGIRYLFSQDLLRPYVGIELAFLQILGQTQNRISVGPGAVAGVDYFLTDSVSIGIRGQFDVFIALNEDPLFAYGGAMSLGIWFN